MDIPICIWQEYSAQKERAGGRDEETHETGLR